MTNKIKKIEAIFSNDSLWYCLYINFGFGFTRKVNTTLLM